MRPEPLAGYAGLIRDVADFPRPGIVFKDILPLLAAASLLSSLRVY